MRQACWVGTALLALAGCSGGGDDAGSAGTSGPAAAAPLARGKAIYDVHCAACHGADGKGDGPAAYLLAPRPRDFTSGRFRLVSTADGIPTDEDLLRTISRGMPGSAMPPFGHLPETDRQALVAHVKSFSRESFEGERERLAPPPETPADAASVERGRAVYKTSCLACHGPEGDGRGPEVTAMVDDAGYPARPRNFRGGVLKGGAAASDLYTRVRAGMPGSPMPAHPRLAEAEVWDAVHFVRTFFPEGAETRGVQERRTLVARRLPAVPAGAVDSLWDRIPATDVVLVPLAWREERTETVSVRAAHDGKTVVFRLSWRTARATETDDFRDGAAVQVATTAEEPSFAMGHAGAPVEILYWQGGDPGVEAARARLVDDSMPGFPDLYAAREAGNPIALALRPASARHEAEGFGTLAVSGPPQASGSTQGHAVYEGGAWHVAIARPLEKPGPRAADLAPGTRRSVAFAVWQGTFRDRNGQKNVSIWHDLELER